MSRPHPDPKPRFRVVRGLPLAHRKAAAALVWAFFGWQIAPGLGERRGRALVRRTLRPERVLAALGGDGELLGLVALRGPGGGMLDLPSGMSGGLTRRLQGGWHARLLEAVIRCATPRAVTADLVLDGLVVAAGARRQGVARALIQAAAAEALVRGHPALRAEVAPGNRGALRLYFAMGFIPQQITGEKWPFLRWLPGRRVVVMRLALGPAREARTSRGAAATLPAARAS